MRFLLDTNILSDLVRSCTAARFWDTRL